MVVLFYFHLQLCFVLYITEDVGESDVGFYFGSSWYGALLFVLMNAKCILVHSYEISSFLIIAFLESLAA